MLSVCLPKYKQYIGTEKKNPTPQNNINLNPVMQTNLIKVGDIFLVLLRGNDLLFCFLSEKYINLLI